MGLLQEGKFKDRITQTLDKVRITLFIFVSLLSSVFAETEKKYYKDKIEVGNTTISTYLNYSELIKVSGNPNKLSGKALPMNEIIKLAKKFIKDNASGKFTGEIYFIKYLPYREKDRGETPAWYWAVSFIQRDDREAGSGQAIPTREILISAGGKVMAEVTKK